MSCKRPDTFYLDDAASIRVPMMHLDKKTSFRCGRVDDLEVLELPYRGETLAMLFLVPPSKTLAQLESRLDAALLQRCVDALKLQPLSFVKLVGVPAAGT